MARSNPQPEQALAQEIKVIGGLLRLLRHLGILRAPALPLAILVGGHHQAPPLRAQRLPPAAGQQEPLAAGQLDPLAAGNLEPLAIGNLDPRLRLAIGNLDPRLRLAIGVVLLLLIRVGPIVLSSRGPTETQHLGQAEIRGHAIGIED